MLALCLSILNTEKDRGLFEMLHNEYNQYMHKIAMSILKDYQLAEDAVQEAFISIIKNFSLIKFKQKCIETKIYFINIVKNKSIDMYRKKVKQSIVSFDKIEDTMTDSITDVEYLIESKGIEMCFKMLPIHYQAVLSMKYHMGHNDSEIATLFDMTENNVKTRCSRAKKKLEQILKEQEVNVR